MRILVTGGAGFIGSNLIQALLLSKHDVFSLDNYSTGYKSNEVEGCIYVNDDILNIDKVFDIQFDVIFHLAALARIHPSFIKPHETFISNVNGTESVLEYARKHNSKVIFSGLDASVAGKVELDFLNSNFVVFSNAKNHRMNPLVPLIVPTVNSDHLVLIDKQRQQFKTDGFLVTNANCSTTGLVVALKALQERFGTLSKVVVTTMQSVSGAGFLILIKVIRGSHL